MQKTNKEGNLTRRNFLKLSGACTAAALVSLPLIAVGRDRGQISQVGKPEKAIPTATGTIVPSKMGITSAHEHVPIPTDPAQKEKCMAFAVRELKKAKELGLQTIIDVGVREDVTNLKEASLASGVNIVCCTGFFINKDEQQPLTVEDFERTMTKDMEDGLQGTQIRPGVIKVGSRAVPTQAEKNLMIAAAHIQKKYSVPICVHSVTACADQQQILEEAGADLKHCYFSHIEATFGWNGRTVDEEIDYLQKIIEKGSTLSFNNFGNTHHTKAEDLAHIIKELTNRGFDDRMVATMDATWSVVDDNVKLLWEDVNVDGKDRTYAYLLNKAVPWMEASGIPKKSVQKFIIDNPRKLFTW